MEPVVSTGTSKAETSVSMEPVVSTGILLDLPHAVGKILFVGSVRLMRENKREFRRHPVHPPPVSRHNEPIILLVTVCTAEQRQLLNSSAVHATLVKAWEQASHWSVGEYVIMPEHVHFFSTPGILEYPPVQRWAGYWKRLAGKINPILKSCFQEDCWDTQMRSREHYEEKLSYVRHNPEKRGLVEHWDEWPYRGQVNQLSWD